MDRFKSREDLDAHLRDQSFIQQWSPLFWHGRLYNIVRWKNDHSTHSFSTSLATKVDNDSDESSLEWLKEPRTTWESTKKPRDDHASNTPSWLTASEFEDHDDIMNTKISLLASLLQLSRRTIVYSGAGISCAAGISQAARGSSSVPSPGGNRYSKKNGLVATPTVTHFALTALAEKGYIHGWIQQNHDGLPQKAGFPQERINEIHGSWFDPSNPVVKYSGSLKSEEYQWLQKETNGDEAADLVLVLGTSLGGLNADQVATKAAERSLDVTGRRRGTLGMVMINLQQTVHDGKSTLRLFGKTDEVMKLLLEKLDDTISIPPRITSNVYEGPQCVIVPYDSNGRRSNTLQMKLDLSPGAKIHLTRGHNIQGAQQPDYMHIGANNSCPGRGKVVRWENESVSIILNIEGVFMRLGQWWVKAAQRGGPAVLPLINIAPQMTKC